MDFDFVSVPDRRGMDALAVDEIGRGSAGSNAPTAPKAGFSAIPMWIADMNFRHLPRRHAAHFRPALAPAVRVFPAVGRLL